MILDFIWVAIGGAIIGSLLNELWHIRSKTHGIIEVDHDTEQCKIHITSNDLSNRKTKKAVFKINHDAKISRDEHTL